MSASGDNGKLVTLFGGTGFVGRHVVQELARAGYRIRVAVRRPDLAGHLQVLGGVGQIHAVQANLRYPASVEQALRGATAAVNAVGILSQSGRQTFDAVHAFGSRMIAKHCASSGIERLVHISSLGANPDSESLYARSKAEAEASVAEFVPQSVILRPSVIFGPEDRFFNRFASMAMISPVVPVIGASAQFQPVFVGDVARAVRATLGGEAHPGRVYELGGPEIVRFDDVMKRMLNEIDRRRFVAPVPLSIAKYIAFVGQAIPGKPITPDQVKLLRYDNIVSPEAVKEGRDLSGLGIDAQPMEAVWPTYLHRFRPAGPMVKSEGPARNL